MPNKTLKKWSCSRLKEITSLKQSKDEVKSLLDTQLVSFVPMECLGINKKYFNSNFEKPIKDLINKYVYFAENDVIMAKITPCFENGKIGIAKNLKNKIGFGSSEYLVFRPNKNVLNEYLYYYLNRNSFREIGAQNMQGAVGHKRLSKEFIEETLIYYPAEIEEQQRIVGILDEAFENIEKAKQNALQNLNNAKELSNTRLNTLINTLTELYDTLKLKDITTKLGDGLHGTPEFNTNGNVYFINGSNLNDGSITIKPDTKLTTEEEFKKYKKELNDRTILVSINGTVGNVAFYNNEKIILGKSACYFNLKENISKEYIKQLIQSNYFLTYANKNASEMTIKNVSLETMRGFPVPMPPLREQEKVSRHIKELQEQTKKLEQIYEQKIKDLDELKQSILQKAFNGEL